jgi:hypothetical protein
MREMRAVLLVRTKAIRFAAFDLPRSATVRATSRSSRAIRSSSGT